MSDKIRHLHQMGNEWFKTETYERQLISWAVRRLRYLETLRERRDARLGGGAEQRRRKLQQRKQTIQLRGGSAELEAS